MNYKHDVECLQGTDGKLYLAVIEKDKRTCKALFTGFEKDHGSKDMMLLMMREAGKGLFDRFKKEPGSFMFKNVFNKVQKVKPFDDLGFSGLRCVAELKKDEISVYGDKGDLSEAAKKWAGVIDDANRYLILTIDREGIPAGSGNERREAIAAFMRFVGGTVAERVDAAPLFDLVFRKDVGDDNGPSIINGLLQFKPDSIFGKSLAEGALRIVMDRHGLLE